jgi:hypothetical protein
MKAPKLTPAEQQAELARLKGLAVDRIARMPYAYQDWGSVRTRAYVAKLEKLNKAMGSVDKRTMRVITRLRNIFGDLDDVATSKDLAALAKGLGCVEQVAQP